MGDRPMEAVLDFAEAASLASIEVAAGPGSRHLDPADFSRARARAFTQALEARDLQVSALAWYTGDLLCPGRTAATQAFSKKVIDAAALIGVDTVCMLAGFADDGRDRLEVIERDLFRAWKPILAHARKRKVRIAIENYYRSLLQGLDTFEALFQAVPDENFGLNYDPSHLVHQYCDHLAPLRLYPQRIFHVHAKDTLIDRGRRRETGIYSTGWWRYVLPGFGQIHWGELISHLRQAAYDGALSIEHEDRTQGVDEGLRRAAWHLEQYC
jgi:sugar phosphate isomerase/epimerase